MKAEFRDDERCRKCGGQCCFIYLECEDGGTKPSTVAFEEWVEGWDEKFEETGASKVEPLFDPLLVHLNGNEHLRWALIAKGINPNKCKYCGKDGCILPRDLRPDSCRHYICKNWEDEIS